MSEIKLQRSNGFAVYFRATAEPGDWGQLPVQHPDKWNQQTLLAALTTRLVEVQFPSISLNDSGVKRVPEKFSSLTHLGNFKFIFQEDEEGTVPAAIEMLSRSSWAAAAIIKFNANGYVTEVFDLRGLRLVSHHHSPLHYLDDHVSLTVTASVGHLQSARFTQGNLAAILGAI